MNHAIGKCRGGWILFVLFFFLLTAPAEAADNLIRNPSFEQWDARDAGTPLYWSNNRWGTNTPVFTYPVAGREGGRAAQVRLTGHTSGDAKWSFIHVGVTPGKTYQFSDFYTSDVVTELIVEYRTTSRTFHHVSLGELPIAADWKAASKSFTVPPGVKSATVYHIIKNVGTLTIDTASLSIGGNGGGGSTGNLISNPSVETVSGNASIPLDWDTDSWGTNTVAFSYPVTGQDGDRWVRAQMTKYTDGDAKWYFKHVPVTSGKTYTFSHYYQSNVPTTLTLEYISTGGGVSYADIGTLPAAADWTPHTTNFIPPANIGAATVLHHIDAVGFLNTDNFSLAVGTGTTGGGSDTSAPSISMTSPANGATLSGMVSLSAEASDNVGIAGVQFLHDSYPIWPEIVSPPYNFSWDTEGAPNGAHEISARARDAAGNVTISAIVEVNTNNPVSDTLSPEVSIVSPSPGAILAGTSSLSIAATDNTEVVTVHYAVTNGTDDIIGQLSSPPYTVVIPPDMLNNGAHTITAYAVDAAGNIGNASPVTYSTFYTPPEPVNPNLIANPSLEAGANGIPDHWAQGNWGANTTLFTYPVAGTNGGRAAQVSMTSRTDGDAKWYFNDVAVTPGANYTFSDQYRSTTVSTLTARYTQEDGSQIYVDIVSELPASTEWIQASQTITIPPNVVKLTVFHLINSIGTLDIDTAELRLGSGGSTGGPNDPHAFTTGLVSLTFDDGWGSQYDNALPMLNAAGIKGSFYVITDAMRDAINANRIENPSHESASSHSTPSDWAGVTTGTNNAVFTYPVAGVSGGKGTKAEITSFTDGDARWQSKDTTVVNGEIYNFTDQYISNVPTKVTVVYTLEDGTTRSEDLGTVPPSDRWTIASFTFTPPFDTESLSISHRLISAGVLTTDDYHLDMAQDYMNTAQALEIHRAGHEVSSHTKTHPFLTQLTEAQTIDEISGSRQDMIAAGFSPSDTFVYPYGDYNPAVLQIAKDAGYAGSRSVDEGYNTKATNKHALMIQQVNSATTVAQWESWTQTAMKNRTWLILMFHQIDKQNGQYGATPENLQSYINYLVTHGIPVVTMEQGVQMMHP